MFCTALRLSTAGRQGSEPRELQLCRRYGARLGGWQRSELTAHSTAWQRAEQLWLCSERCALRSLFAYGEVVKQALLVELAD